MKIIVGLGNPGAEFEKTYHNVGMMAMDAMLGQQKDGAPDQAATFKFKKYKGLFEYTTVPDAVFVRPLTYMNDSGRPVLEALKKFKAKPGDLIVFQDDSDIGVGDIKTSFARSSAGHKGVQSIIDFLKTNAFTRIRIGIRKKNETPRKKAGEFALKPISASDRAAFEKVFQEISKNITAST